VGLHVAALGEEAGQVEEARGGVRLVRGGQASEDLTGGA